MITNTNDTVKCKTANVRAIPQSDIAANAVAPKTQKHENTNHGWYPDLGTPKLEPLEHPGPRWSQSQPPTSRSGCGTPEVET